jgi:hypothetical protein
MSKMNKGQVFILDPIEQKIVEFIGKQRHEQNCKVGRGNGTINKNNTDELDIVGFGAELIFCRELNLFPDFKIDIFSKHEGTDYYDAYIWGKSVDVKVNRNIENPLMVPTRLKSECQLFALFSAKYPKYRFEGFATNHMLFKKSNIRQTKVPAYVLEKSKLLGIDELEI